jgi:hypothetical protein
MKTKALNTSGALAFAVVIGTDSALADGDLFKGSIQYDGTATPNPVVANGGWANSGTQLSWDIKYDVAGNPSFPWLYTYTWQTSGEPELSHIVIEISPSAVEVDFLFFENPEAPLDEIEFGSDGTSGTAPSPPPPSALPNGIKWNTDGNPTTLTWSFRSTRPPTWGDFYAKGGPSSAYNFGYGNPDADPPATYIDFDEVLPAEFLHDGPRAFHISVPDTGLIPEPSTYAFGAGLLGLAAWSLRRRFMRQA